MKKGYLLILSFFILLITPGCWDQDLLKDARLLYGVGFDLMEEGQLLGTFVIRDMPAGEQQTEAKVDIFYTTGKTTRDVREKADNKMSGKLRSFKNRVFLVGEELAKQDIYPLLDVVYRDPKSAINARIAVTQGKAQDVLSLKKVGNILIGEEIDELIKDNEEKTVVPKENIQTICSIMLDPGEDFLLPYLTIKDNRIDASQSAMFHRHHMTGILNSDETTMFLLLKGDLGKRNSITKKINQLGEESGYDFITFDVKKAKRKMKVLVQPNNEIVVKLDANWKVEVQEFPKDHLDDENFSDRISKMLSEEMTNSAKQTIRKMQEANCDGLGIGRQLIAFHPTTWKKINWEEEYPKVRFEPNIQVEIVQTGILN